MKFRRTKKKTEVVDKDVQECPVEVVCAMVPFVTKEGHMRFRYSFSHEAPFSERQTAVTTSMAVKILSNRDKYNNAQKRILTRNYEIYKAI